MPMKPLGESGWSLTSETTNDPAVVVIDAVVEEENRPCTPTGGMPSARGQWPCWIKWLSKHADAINEDSGWLRAVDRGAKVGQTS